MTGDLPPSLDRFGRELEAAIRRDLGSGLVQSRAGARRRRAGALLAAAVIVAAVVMAQPGGRPLPAYALVRHVGGSVTVTVRSLEGAIAPLNRRFSALGIDETVLPVATGCKTAAVFVTTPADTSSDRLTFRTGRQLLLPGWHGIIAARSLRSGRVTLVLGAVRGQVPACVALAPAGHVLGFRHLSGAAASSAGGSRASADEVGIAAQSRLLAVAVVGSHSLKRSPARGRR